MSRKDGGMFPNQMNKELAKALFSGTEDVFLLANPNHMVIGQLVYDTLDDNQKSLFQKLVLSSEICNYVSNNTGRNRYNIYTNKKL